MLAFCAGMPPVIGDLRHTTGAVGSNEDDDDDEVEDKDDDESVSIALPARGTRNSFVTGDGVEPSPFLRFASRTPASASVATNTRE